MSFIEERCRALNSGLPISDEFETEIANMDRLKMQTVNPEVIQQAVQSVKENASDVIGALKDRVTGIQLRRLVLELRRVKTTIVLNMISPLFMNHCTRADHVSHVINQIVMRGSKARRFVKSGTVSHPNFRRLHQASSSKRVAKLCLEQMMQ
ncbi:hypothetical protein Y032_0004g2236 [Ancylostoma ceylanicum]|uniref:Uncharacterized protein n=1 Tax=Ancylostoma ceylanicum TaxID=53326 RepID=A0A016VW31_9BILA|nr:hypothetical protein Y032_0004g2236 [Ancylostoma ceylanicum]